MNNFIVYFLFIFIFNTTYAQIDSIEYCIGEEIFKFSITNKKYQFREWEDNLMVEEDSLIFNPDVFFNNYVNNNYQSSYVDSLMFVISSRTLKKFFNEDVFYNKNDSMIRICYFKEEIHLL